MKSVHPMAVALMLLAGCQTSSGAPDARPPVVTSEPGADDPAEPLDPAPPEPALIQSACTEEPPPDPGGGCTWQGPWPGELGVQGAELLSTDAQGQPLAELEFQQALAACFEARESCHGISSMWYLGMPYKLFKAPVGAAFQPDSASYGCTYLLVCQ